MSNHPIVLMIRFLLEIFGLYAYGFFGWRTGSGLSRTIFAVLIPLAAAAIWGVFRVPNDPGPAPVSVPGWTRLGIEIIYFSLAALLLFFAGQKNAALILGGVFLLLYVVSFDRLIWLVKEN